MNTLNADVDSARDIDSAIDLLSGNNNSSTVGSDRMKEITITKKQKALYNSYYASQLPILKSEKPGLKLSQYKNIIFEAVRSVFLLHCLNIKFRRL